MRFGCLRKWQMYSTFWIKVKVYLITSIKQCIKNTWENCFQHPQFQILNTPPQYSHAIFQPKRQSTNNSMIWWIKPKDWLFCTKQGYAFIWNDWHSGLLRLQPGLCYPQWSVHLSSPIMRLWLSIPMIVKFSPLKFSVLVSILDVSRVNKALSTPCYAKAVPNGAIGPLWSLLCRFFS